MKYSIILFVLIVLVLGVTCFKRSTDITDIEEVRICSYQITSQDIYKSDPSLIFKVMYGEYEFSDSTRLLINPNGEFFQMNRLSSKEYEIIEHGYLTAGITESGKLIIEHNKNIQIQGEVLICNNVIWDVSENKTGYLVCKCTL